MLARCVYSAHCVTHTMECALTAVVVAQTLRVRRIYDSDRKTLLYVAYATHSISGDDGPGRYRSAAPD